MNVGSKQGLPFPPSVHSPPPSNGSFAPEGSSAEARGAGRGTLCRLGHALGQSLHSSQSSRQLQIHCLCESQ